MTRGWQRLAWVAGAAIVVLLVVAATAPAGLRCALRHAYYAHVRGTPLIKEQPRTPVNCRGLGGPRTLVALAFGQSNAANFGRGRHTPEQGVFEMHEGRCYAAVDPLIGGDGDGGSVWTRLGERLVRERRYERVVFVGMAVGGTAIARWAPGGDLHPRIISAIAQGRSAGLEVTHLLWHQGERDADLGTSEAAYALALAQMVHAIRATGSRAPVFVSRASYCFGVSSEGVRRAQAAAVSPAAGVFAGPDTDALRGPLLRYDDCHFGSAGLQAVAEAWGQALAAQAASL